MAYRFDGRGNPLDDDEDTDLDEWCGHCEKVRTETCPACGDDGSLARGVNQEYSQPQAP